MKIICGNHEGYNINNSWKYGNKNMNPYSEPFYVENTTGSNQTLYIKKNKDNAIVPTLTIEYSTDKVNWSTLGQTSYSTALTRTVQPGQKIYLRCNAVYWGKYSGSEYCNYIKGVSKVGGNLLSLIYGSSFNGQTEFRTGEASTFYGLFSPIDSDNNELVDASELLLLAMTLPESCYDSMFRRCVNLTAAPYLPATTLTKSCYSWMFRYCYNLHEVRCNAINTSATECTNSWLNEAPSTGTFYKNTSKTNWSRGGSGIPNNWTIVDL